MWGAGPTQHADREAPEAAADPGATPSSSPPSGAAERRRPSTLHPPKDHVYTWTPASASPAPAERSEGCLEHSRTRPWAAPSPAQWAGAGTGREEQLCSPGLPGCVCGRPGLGDTQVSKQAWPAPESPHAGPTWTDTEEVSGSATRRGPGSPDAGRGSGTAGATCGATPHAVPSSLTLRSRPQAGSCVGLPHCVLKVGKKLCENPDLFCLGKTNKTQGMSVPGEGLP